MWLPQSNIFGDLKPSNVLLDQDMVAHLSDFGLVRFLSDHPLRPNHVQLERKKTICYIAPGYYFFIDI